MQLQQSISQKTPENWFFYTTSLALNYKNQFFSTLLRVRLTVHYFLDPHTVTLFKGVEISGRISLLIFFWYLHVFTVQLYLASIIFPRTKFVGIVTTCSLERCPFSFFSSLASLLITLNWPSRKTRTNSLLLVQVMETIFNAGFSQEVHACIYASLVKCSKPRGSGIIFTFWWLDSLASHKIYL